MDSFNLSNPILLIGSGFGLLALLYFGTSTTQKKIALETERVSEKVITIRKKTNHHENIHKNWR